jgi:signal transduction histidine kinase
VLTENAAVVQPSCRWLWCLPFILAVLDSADAGAADRQKRVLVVYSTRPHAQVSVVGDREIPRILGENLTEVIDYYAEHVDQARFQDPQYEQAFHDFLRLKYGSHRFDVIIAVSEVALAFLEKHRSELFPATPLVFFTTDLQTHRIANATGVKAVLNLSDTVALALDLQPDTRNVFVVSGASSSDKFYEIIARSQLRSFEPRLAITYLSGLATRALETRLATLPSDSIVLYLTVAQDGAGQNFHPLPYADRVAAAARVPTYCWVDSAIGGGIVGGSMRDQQLEMQAIANLTLRVLRGEPADTIAVEEHDFNVPQLDWRQLRRWKISEARVPAGARILFREPSLWDQYYAYILPAIALLLAQTGLIAGLLIERARRRQAEELVRGNQAELRRSYERIRDLGRRLLKAQEAERSRIARELHDDVSQQVTLLAIDMDLLSRIQKPSKYGARLALDVSARTQSVARRLHDLSHRLHPAKLQLIGLVAAIEGLRRDLSSPNLDITFSHRDVPASLPEDLSLCLFRTVQEGMGNAIRHSGASRISVQLSGNTQGLVLIIDDDGVGFDVDQAWDRGLGLISMVERVEQIGGRLHVRSARGAGTNLVVSVPCSCSVDEHTAT